MKRNSWEGDHTSCEGDHGMVSIPKGRPLERREEEEKNWKRTEVERDEGWDYSLIF